MSRSINVALWGLGAMGGGIARLCLQKQSLKVTAAIANSPGKIGRDLGDVIGLGRQVGVVIGADPDKELSKPDAEIVLISTMSFTREVFPQIKLALEKGMNVITIAEEMAYPHVAEPELTREIDRLAKENGVSVLGTGINPGFVFDTLIICLTGIAADVKSIKASRINDLSPFGPTVMQTQGVGTTEEEFRRGVEQGTIVGHVGFPESISMIASALGWKLDSISQKREPIISQVRRETPHVKVEPGMVAGCRHSAWATMGESTVIELVHPQQIHPGLEGVETGDYIQIRGTPDINLSIKPEIPGGTGTIALAVNTIPAVVNARPGLLTMADLPVPRALLGDIAKR